MAKKKPAKPKVRIVKTIAAVAKALSIAPRTFSDYLALGCPGSQGTYDLDKIEAWRRVNIKGTEESPKDQADIERRRAKHDAEIEKLREEVYFRRAKRERDQGLYYKKADVDQCMAEAFVRLKNRLEKLPDEFEMTFPAESRAMNKSDMVTKIRSILRELSRWQVEEL